MCQRHICLPLRPTKVSLLSGEHAIFLPGYEMSCWPAGQHQAVPPFPFSCRSKDLCVLLRPSAWDPRLEVQGTD